MWLKAKIMDALLADSKITRSELAQEFECNLSLLNAVIDGRDAADEELARLLIAAFGAEDMAKAIDWRRTAV